MLKADSRATRSGASFAVLISILAPLIFTASALPPTSLQRQGAAIATPKIDANFIYQQLDYMAIHFLKREAGYDDHLSPDKNGHDEFASYWTQEMLTLLGHYGAQSYRDVFPIQGWQARPTSVPAVNVEITVPGIIHPEQIVVIGCHYDGMAFSTQSAYDDASGCAIELGVAKAMSEFWSANHLYPARTLRFVIFDAEEPGLLGSYHYVNSTSNGDLRNIVAMFNEEQNGIDYPLRYLGKLSNPLLPYYIDMSPLQSNDLYNQTGLTSQQRANISAFRQLMQQAVAAAFQEFRAMGYQALTYHGASGQDVWQPIFSADQLSNIHLEDDTLGASDQMAFTMAGLPCATLAGNSTYYNANAPAGSYPFDQPSDTIQLMNTFADGTASQSQALTLALGLPGLITSWMLSQPTMLGQTPTDGKPIATITSLGATQTGQSMQFSAGPAYDPTQTGATFNYQWNFGDGTSASGQTVDHIYKQSGNYTLSLTVTSSGGGARAINKQLRVGQASTYDNPYNGYSSDGKPATNAQVILPVAGNGPGDRVSGSPTQVPAQTPRSTSSKTGGSVLSPTSPALIAWPFIGIGIVFIVIVVIIILRWLWRK
ncbi:MAG TPA: M28 family peptidase [Ktedonobacteraceae bacterium]